MYESDVLTDESDEACLGTIGESHWKIFVKVNGQEQTFHIDTGTEVTVITEACMKLSEALRSRKP